MIAYPNPHPNSRCIVDQSLRDIITFAKAADIMGVATYDEFISAVSNGDPIVDKWIKRIKEIASNT